MQHEFVEFMPEVLQKDTIYVSFEYKTATHLCVCGCKREVVTPLSPTDWQLIFNGVSISLRPSIGSWDFPCRSHYFITNNKVEWAGNWTEEQIKITKQNDALSKKVYYGNLNSKTEAVNSTSKTKGMLSKILSYFFK